MTSASSCSAIRRRRWARSPRPSAGALLAAIDLADADGRADRVVRAVGGRQDRHGLAAARTSTGWRACCAGSSSTPSAGGEVNVVVAGINVGAQPYWNAEATMLMHTRGILVMTPDSAMVLTGKQAIDYSGGVSAEDNLGIGGYERIMGPNGEAQYWAPTSPRRATMLLAHHELTYRAPGRALAAAGGDRPIPVDRDVRARPARRRGQRLHDRRRHLLRRRRNPDRKKPFDIRTLMGAIDRPRPRAARAVAGDGRGRDGRRLRRPPRRARR